MKSHALRIERLERIAYANSSDEPVAAVVDDEGRVLKVMGRGGEWSKINQQRDASQLPDCVKVYGFDPETTDLAEDS